MVGTGNNNYRCSSEPFAVIGKVNFGEVFRFRNHNKMPGLKIYRRRCKPCGIQNLFKLLAFNRGVFIVSDRISQGNQLTESHFFIFFVKKPLFKMKQKNILFKGKPKQIVRLNFKYSKFFIRK